MIKKQSGKIRMAKQGELLTHASEIRILGLKVENLGNIVENIHEYAKKRFRKNST